MFQVIYFHKGALVYSNQPDAASSMNQTRLTLPQNSLPSIAKLVSHDASKFKISKLPVELGKDALFSELVEDLTK